MSKEGTMLIRENAQGKKNIKATSYKIYKGKIHPGKINFTVLNPR